MKKKLLLIFLALATGTAYASQPTEQSVEELLSILIPEPQSHIRSATRAKIAIYAQELSRIAYKNPSASEINDTYRIVDEAFEKQLSWESLKTECVMSYQAHFTQEEIDGLITFFKGRVGQAWLREMPSVSYETQRAIDKKMKELMAKPPQPIVDLLSKSPKEPLKK